MQRCFIMAFSADPIVKVVILGIAVVLGIVLFADMVVPIVIDTVGDLTGDYNRYNTLLYLLPMVGIFGLMILVVRVFTENNR